MDLINILTFSGAMFLFALSPGVGIFAVVSNALSSGFKSSSFMALGMVLGDVVFLLLAIFGLSAIANILGELFILVKYLGGAYLLYLGYKILTSKVEDANLEAKKELSLKKNFLTGLFITLGNPKVIVFYLGFLPTFVNLQTLTAVDIIIVTTLVSIILGAVLLAYAFSASSAKNMFKSKKSRKNMNIVSGSVMMGVGGVLIAKP